jgi:hypothetical protein
MFPNVGPAPAVDRLRVVAHDGEVPVPRRDEVDDLGLQRVGVLVLVDEHVLELVGDDPGDRLVLGHQPPPVDEQVVVVHRVAGALALLVEAVDALDLRRDGLEVRVRGGDDVGDGSVGVVGETDDVAHHRWFREAARARVDGGLVDASVDEVGGVLGVEDREVGGVAERLRVPAQKPVAHRVERPAPHAPHFRPDQPLHAPHHLARRAVGEGDEEDPRSRDARLDEPGDPVRHRARLARAGAGDDELRAVARSDHAVLFVVEGLAVVDEETAGLAAGLDRVPLHGAGDYIESRRRGTRRARERPPPVMRPRRRGS